MKRSNNRVSKVSLMQTLYIFSFCIFIATINLHAAAPNSDLVAAIQHKNIAYINAHLTNNNVNSREGHCSLLHHAAWYGHKNMVSKLLSCGAKVNALSNDKSTPLHYAVASGFEDIVVILLEHGADRYAKDINEKTASAIATENNFSEIAKRITDWDDSLDIKGVEEDN